MEYNRAGDPSATKALSQIINNPTVATIQYGQEGSMVGNGNGKLIQTLGSIDTKTGKGPGVTLVDPEGIKIYLLAPRQYIGMLPGSMMSNEEPGTVDSGLILWHELGHTLGWMNGATTGPETDKSARDLENTIRTLDDPKAPIRTREAPPF